MTYKFCTVETKGHVLEVTINRPDVMNALHPHAHDEMEVIWNHLENKKDLWAAILTGAGDKAFCLGVDVKFQSKAQNTWLPNTGVGGLTTRYTRKKPIIAALNGAALGIGLELALACDLIIAAEHAEIGLPEPRMGMFAGGGGIQMLRQQIGRKAANEILLTGRRFSASEAKEMGLINHVVPAGDLMKAARQMAAEICECSPRAIRATKQIINRLDADEGYISSMERTTRAMMDLGRSPDMKEGMKAFLQKRKPRWK